MPGEGTLRKATIGTGNDVFATDEALQSDNGLADKLQMFDDVGRIADQTGTSVLPSGNFTVSHFCHSCSCRGLAISSE